MERAIEERISGMEQTTGQMNYEVDCWFRWLVFKEASIYERQDYKDGQLNFVAGAQDITTTTQKSAV